MVSLILGNLKPCTLHPPMPVTLIITLKKVALIWETPHMRKDQASLDLELLVTSIFP